MPNMTVDDGQWSQIITYPATLSDGDTTTHGATWTGSTQNKFVDKNIALDFKIRDGVISPTLTNTGLSTYFTASDGTGTPSISLTPSTTVTKSGWIDSNATGSTSYYNIIPARFAVGGGSAWVQAPTFTTNNVTLTETNTGISLKPSVVYGHYSVNFADPVVGWIDKAAGDTIIDAERKSYDFTNYYYISAITVPKDQSFSVTTTADTALDTTSDLDIINNAFRRIDITNKGTVISTQSTSGKGNVIVKAYGDSSNTTVIENGAWVTPTVNAAATYYGKVVVPAGVLSGEGSVSTNSTVTPSVDISGTPSDYGITTTQPTGTDGTNYLTFDPDASATSYTINTSGKVTTAGYIGTGTATGSSVTGTPTIAAGTNKYMPIVTASFSGGGLSTTTNTNTIATNAVVTISASGTFTTTGQTSYGVTGTKPSGTDGTDYLTINGGGSVTTTGKATSNWTATRATTTYTNSAGAIEAHSGTTALASDTLSGSKSVNIFPTIVDDFYAHYIPITSVSIVGGGLSKTDFAKNDLAVTLATGSETNMSNITIGAKSTTTYPYYFKVNGSTPAVEGTTTVDRAAVTYSNSAGAIEAHAAGTSAISADSLDANVSVNAASGSTYISLKKATFSVNANKVYCSAAGYIGVDATNAVGTIPTGTIVNNTTLPSGSSSSGTLNRGNYIKIGAGYYANDLYYMAATNSGGTITIEHGGNSGVDGYAIAYVPYATITYGTTTVSGSTATRGIIAITPGWIDTTSTPTNPDISRLGVATFANTASAGTTYVDISNTSAAPILISGDYLYINEGWTDNLKISLAKLVPDVPSGKTVAPANYILSGYAAFDADGAVIAGTMETYDGTYTLSYY